MPTQQNIDPPQPQGQGEYPISALRPSYIREFQNQDEAQKAGFTVMSNPKIPVKRWVDSRTPTAAIVTYNTAHLDASFQHPITTTLQISSFLTGILNMPPDTGARDSAWATAGEYLVPVRDLLPNEKLVPRQMGLFDVVNTDIYDPNPPAAPVAVSGSGISDADRATLNATFALVTKIANSMGLQ